MMIGRGGQIMNFVKIRIFIFGLVQKKFSLESPYVVKVQKKNLNFFFKWLDIGMGNFCFNKIFFYLVPNFTHFYYIKCKISKLRFM